MIGSESLLNFRRVHTSRRAYKYNAISAAPPIVLCTLRIFDLSAVYSTLDRCFRMYNLRESCTRYRLKLSIKAILYEKLYRSGETRGCSAAVVAVNGVGCRAWLTAALLIVVLGRCPVSTDAGMYSVSSLFNYLLETGCIVKLGTCAGLLQLIKYIRRRNSCTLVGLHTEADLTLCIA